MWMHKSFKSPDTKPENAIHKLLNYDQTARVKEDLWRIRQFNWWLIRLVCEIPRSFERSIPSHFRTQGSFIHINSGKIFERDLVSSDSVAKSATQKTLGFLRL